MTIRTSALLFAVTTAAAVILVCADASQSYLSSQTGRSHIKTFHGRAQEAGAKSVNVPRSLDPKTQHAERTSLKFTTLSRDSPEERRILGWLFDRIKEWIKRLLDNVGEWWNNDEDKSTWTVFDVVALSPAHGTLQTLVSIAGLNSALQESDAEYTLFAPTNDAFEDLAQENSLLYTKLSSGSDTWKPLLKEVLLFHALAIEVKTDDFTDEATSYATIAAAANLVLQAAEPHIQAESPGQGHADINYPDMKTTNGIVHSIDAVLLPPSASRTVVGVATSSSDFTTLVSLAVSAGLEELLSTDTENSMPVTLFAPTNAAFSKLPAELV
eukprot:3020877-Rhodomonas_salina.1